MNWGCTRLHNGIQLSSSVALLFSVSCRLISLLDGDFVVDRSSRFFNKFINIILTFFPGLIYSWILYPWSIPRLFSFRISFQRRQGIRTPRPHIIFNLGLPSIPIPSLESSTRRQFPFPAHGQQTSFPISLAPSLLSYFVHSEERIVMRNLCCICFQFPLILCLTDFVECVLLYIYLFATPLKIHPINPRAIKTLSSISSHR